MKKRVLSALLVLCLACGLVSTAWATGQSTPETAAVSVTDAASGETAQEEPLPDEIAGEPASDETVEGTAAPVADGTEYTAALDVDGQTLNVIVTAPDGAFAEGVDPQLRVTMLAAEDELNAVADELDKAQVEYDGFAAMDITFTDKITGEEIEPAQQVSVRIELPQAIVDSGIDLSTLAVQHLEEDADGNVQNVTEVATLDNGITLSEEAAAAVNEAAGVAPMSDLPAEEATAGDAAETPAAVAEFEVDGFSKFTITYSYGSRWNPKTAKLDVICATLNGQTVTEITDAEPERSTISMANSSANVAYLNVPDVPGYEYTGTAYIKTNGGLSQVYRIRYNENSRAWQYNLSQYGSNWELLEDNQLYFIYEKLETIIKVVKKLDGVSNIEDENYNVELSITNGNEEIASKEFKLEDFADGRTATWEVVVPNAESNATYTITETASEAPDRIVYRVLDSETQGSTTSSNELENFKLNLQMRAGQERTVEISNVYNSDTTTSEETSATVTTEKKAELQEGSENLYDLTLSISGERGNFGGGKIPVDILFIVDKSGSMKKQLDSDDDAGEGEESRMSSLQTAISGLLDTIEENPDVDARYAAVSFSSSTMITTTEDYWAVEAGSNGWSSASVVEDYIDDLTLNGGTNYQSGIEKAKEMLETVRDNAQTFVIFVSDGEPTFRWEDDNDTRDGDTYETDWWGNVTENYASSHGNGNSDPYGYNIYAAVEEIQDMSCTGFYGIGIGPDFGQGWHEAYYQWNGSTCETIQAANGDKRGTANLKRLADEVNAAATGVYSATATQDLQNAFADIATQITFFAAKDVTITDPLSQYADLVLTNGAPQFTITVTREESEGVGAGLWTGTVGDGQTVTFEDAKGVEQNATARVSADKGTIYMDLPDDYELEPGYTYSISTVITPSQNAITAGMNSGAAQMIPDANTGTHEGESGFYCNDYTYDEESGQYTTTAKVTYIANDADGSELFPKPVIQVPEVVTGDLSLTKELAEKSQDLVPTDTEFEFTITIPAGENDANVKTYEASYVMAAGSTQEAHEGTGVTFVKDIDSNPVTATATVELYAGETVTIKELPKDITPTITEKTATWYTSSGLENIGQIPANDTLEVTCINTLQTGNLTLTKNVYDESQPKEDSENEYETITPSQAFTFQVTATGSVRDLVKNHEFGSEGSKLDFNANSAATIDVTADSPVIITGLPYGTYQVTEINLNEIGEITVGDAEYYFTRNDIEENPGYKTATVDADGENVSIANYYKPYRTVTIEKMVDGKMGATTVPFNFTTSVQRGTDEVSIVGNGGTTAIATFNNSETVTATLTQNSAIETEENRAQFTTGGYTLAHTEYITITKLKDGDTLVINELDGTSQGYTVTYTEDNGTIDNNKYSVNGDGSIIIKNFRDVVTPTGLETNHTAPYTILVTVAGIAGLALIGGIVARRRRRRME